MRLSTNVPTAVTLARLAGITRICFGTAFIVAPRASARGHGSAQAPTRPERSCSPAAWAYGTCFSVPGSCKRSTKPITGPRRAGSATAPPPALSTQARPWRLPLASPRRSRVPALHHRRSRNRHAARSATPGPTTTNRTAHPREVHRRQMLAPPQNGNGHPRHEWRVMRSVPRHDRMAWAALIMIAALLVQFVLGMAVNLFVTIPAHHPRRQPQQLLRRSRPQRGLGHYLRPATPRRARDPRHPAHRHRGSSLPSW